MQEATAAVVEALAKLEPIPSHLLVSLEGGEEAKRISVPNVRKRWVRVAKVLDALPWATVEAQDKSGGTLAIIRAQDDTPAAPPPFTPAAMPDGGGVTLRERELLETMAAVEDRAVVRMLQAQEAAFGRIATTLQRMTDAVAAQLEMVTASTRAVSAQVTEALTLQRQLTVQGGEDDDGPHGIEAMAPLLEMVRQHSQSRRARPAAGAKADDKGKKKP